MFQLKLKLGRVVTPLIHLPPVNPASVVQVELEEILDRHSRGFIIELLWSSWFVGKDKHLHKQLGKYSISLNHLTHTLWARCFEGGEYL